MIVLLQKLLKIFTAMILLFIAGYMAFVLSILLWSPPSNLNKGSYDGIIVLTGANGRIETGFNLLLDEVSPHLLISGVQDDIDFNNLVAVNSKKLTHQQKQKIVNHCCISLDYIADTTETNAIESKKWIKNKKLKDVLIVTSAAHMPRAYLQYRARIDNNVQIHTYPYFRASAMSLIKDKKFWYNSVKEYFKFHGSLIQIAKE